MKLSDEIATHEFLANLGKSYKANERDLIQRCIEYRGHDISIEAPCFEGMDEWIIIKQEEGGEAWEKMNPELFLYSIPKELIHDILCEDFISVFDVLVCVGFNSGYLDASDAVSQSLKTFISELARGNLKPREPSTKEIWTPEINGLACLGFPKVYPDLSWVLSFEEAEAWAVKSFATSLKALRERIGAELDGDTEPATDAESQEPHELEKENAELGAKTRKRHAEMGRLRQAAAESSKEYWAPFIAEGNRLVGEGKPKAQAARIVSKRHPKENINHDTLRQKLGKT